MVRIHDRPSNRAVHDPGLGCRHAHRVPRDRRRWHDASAALQLPDLRRSESEGHPVQPIPGHSGRGCHLLALTSRSHRRTTGARGDEHRLARMAEGTAIDNGHLPSVAGRHGLPRAARHLGPARVHAERARCRGDPRAGRRRGLPARRDARDSVPAGRGLRLRVPSNSHRTAGSPFGLLATNCIQIAGAAKSPSSKTAPRASVATASRFMCASLRNS